MSQQQSGSILVTAETYQYLEERCETLRGKIADGSRDLGSLFRDDKDETVNQMFKEAQRELDMLRGQLVEAEYNLANAKLAPQPPCDMVAIGNRVLVKMCCGHNEPDEEMEVVVDGLCDCGRAGVQVVTPESPIGAAIMGTRVGDECLCRTPKGTVQIVIVSISRL